MKKYDLLNEWKRKTIYGDDLADALIREGSLERPAVHLGSGLFEDGETLRIGKIIKVHTPANSTRGGHPYVQAIVEAPAPFTNSAAHVPGRVFEVDAIESDI